MRVFKGFVILFCLHVEFSLLVHLVSGQGEEWVVAIVRESEGPSASVSGVDEELGDSFTTMPVSGDEKEIRSRSVYLVPGDTLDVKGAWTILPLLPKCVAFSFFRLNCILVSEKGSDRPTA